LRRDDILRALQERPFRPFRLVLTGGITHEIRHPEMAIVTPSTVFIGVPAVDAPAPAAGDVVVVSLLHIVQIEYLPLPASPATN
jgi:hypothetical protein